MSPVAKFLPAGLDQAKSGIRSSQIWNSISVPSFSARKYLGKAAKLIEVTILCVVVTLVLSEKDWINALETRLFRVDFKLPCCSGAIKFSLVKILIDLWLELLGLKQEQ
jgi:hypothetical protein